MTERPPNPSDPTAERPSEQSTQTASGLSSGRPGMEQGRRREGDELIPREGETRTGDDRTNKEDRDPVMPGEDTTTGPKI